jgi:DNA-binding NtrC family response regulator
MNPDTTNWAIMASHERPKASARRILLVDDESMILQCSAMALIRAGYQVKAVDRSQAAWEALQSGRYDLLITDNQMPGMTGLELVRKVRPEQPALPVILASGGFGEAELAENAWLQPAIALPKPFTSNMLLAVVAEAMGGVGHNLAQPAISFPESDEPHSHWGINE